MLEIQDLSKSYPGPTGTVQALAGVSLRVGTGQFVVVQGPSGCGKTTLLLAAGALLKPDQGRIHIRGQELSTLSSEARAQFRAKHIGFVFQQFHLVPYLSVLENVLAASLSTATGDASTRVRFLIARFGLEGRAQHYPSQLSTGERQRAALARALLNRPSLVLADEPTGNLDSENAQTVLNCLHEFAREGGAVLLVTHNPGLVQHGDRVIRLKAGQLTGEE